MSPTLCRTELLFTGDDSWKIVLFGIEFNDVATRFPLVTFKMSFFTRHLFRLPYYFYFLALLLYTLSYYVMIFGLFFKCHILLDIIHLLLF